MGSLQKQPIFYFHQKRRLHMPESIGNMPQEAPDTLQNDLIFDADTRAILEDTVTARFESEEVAPGFMLVGRMALAVAAANNEARRRAFEIGARIRPSTRTPWPAWQGSAE